MGLLGKVADKMECSAFVSNSVMAIEKLKAADARGDQAACEKAAYDLVRICSRYPRLANEAGMQAARLCQPLRWRLRSRTSCADWCSRERGSGGYWPTTKS